MREEVERLKEELEAVRLTSKKQEEDLYFLREKENITHTENKEILLPVNEAHRGRFFEEGSFKTIANDSHLLSFSLTSVMEESVPPQQEKSTRRNTKQHMKVNSDFSQPTDPSDKLDSKTKKEPSSNFKKPPKKDQTKAEGTA